MTTRYLDPRAARAAAKGEAARAEAEATRAETAQAQHAAAAEQRRLACSTTSTRAPLVEMTAM